MKLCDCGCGHPAPLAPRNEKRKGWIKGQPIRFIKNHSLGAPRLEWGEALWDVEDRGFQSPCWIWKFAKNNMGYGIFRNSTRLGNSTLAHRESFLRSHGCIPDDLTLDHLCGIRNCVRPEHLEPVTHAENVRRGRGARMTPEIRAEIFELRKAGLTQTAIATKVGFSRTAVVKLLDGSTWT